MGTTVLTWNCRGARSALFHKHLKDLLSSYKPSVLALFETKVHSSVSIPHICKYSCLTKLICTDAQGFVGGI